MKKNKKGKYEWNERKRGNEKGRVKGKHDTTHPVFFRCDKTEILT